MHASLRLWVCVFSGICTMHVSESMHFALVRVCMCNCKKKKRMKIIFKNNASVCKIVDSSLIFVLSLQCECPLQNSMKQNAAYVLVDLEFLNFVVNNLSAISSRDVEV